MERRHGNLEESSSDSRYERPWYDSSGVVTAASLMILPLGIWGVAKRRGMAKTGISNFWHHTVPLWIAAAIPYFAPLALYGFWKRTDDEHAPTEFSDYVGLVLAGAMSVLLLGLSTYFVRLIV
jgi:hypothetical protein